MYSLETILFASLGGFLPVLLWLIFWLREDSAIPEPRMVIIRTFLGGMAVVLLALVLEQAVNIFFESGSLAAVTLWAVVEESLKLGAAVALALASRVNDEPVDPMIYLITAALGFAALENAFFLLAPFADGNFAQGLITGNLRFVGSTLLHTVTSGSIGIFLAFAYCELRGRKILMAALGLVLAVLLHTLFNFFILKGESGLFTIFGFVWVGIVLLILFMERIKSMNRTCIINS